MALKDVVDVYGDEFYDGGVAYDEDDYDYEMRGYDDCFDDYDFEEYDRLNAAQTWADRGCPVGPGLYAVPNIPNVTVSSPLDEIDDERDRDDEWSCHVDWDWEEKLARDDFASEIEGDYDFDRREPIRPRNLRFNRAMLRAGFLHWRHYRRSGTGGTRSLGEQLAHPSPRQKSSRRGIGGNGDCTRWERERSNLRRRERKNAQDFREILLDELTPDVSLDDARDEFQTKVKALAGIEPEASEADLLQVNRCWDDSIAEEYYDWTAEWMTWIDYQD